MRVPRSFAETLWPFAGLPMVFVHTPKCSGSYIANAFGYRFKRCPTLRWPEMRGHLTWREYQQRFAARGIDLARDYVTFSVVRNPWAWHVSWFTYIRADQGGHRSGHKVEAGLFARFGFPDYLDWLEDPDAPRGPQGYMQRQLRDWLTDADGNLAVDHVLRTETAAQDLAVLRDRYGLRIAIPARPANVSSRADYRSFYRSADIDRIAHRHAGDISLFNYAFG
jgi:hypothetical protein